MSQEHHCIDCHFLSLQHQWGFEEVPQEHRDRVRAREQDWRRGLSGHPCCYHGEWGQNSNAAIEPFEEMLTKERATCDFVNYLPGVQFAAVERRRQRTVSKRAALIAITTLVVAALSLLLNLIQFLGRNGALPTSIPVPLLPTITPIP